MAYNFLTTDLVEARIIPRETRQQMWQRLRDEEARLAKIYLREQELKYPNGRPIFALPMSEEMERELMRINQKLAIQSRKRDRKRKSRFTSAKPEPAKEPKVEEVKQENGHEEAEVEIPKRKHNPMLDGCRSIDVYEPLNKIDEGSYGIVFRAREKATGIIYAVKKVKLEREKEGFPITALREIVLMMELKHPNIVKVKEVVFGSSLDKVYVVMDFIDHEIKSLVQQSYDAMMDMGSIGKEEIYALSTVEIKCIMKQLLKGVAFMHKHWIIHRDLKTSNLLVSNTGVVKICDFGLARNYSDPVSPYTELVVTLWYRSPELLLGKEKYDGKAVDMWSVGCIMAELLLKEPIFMGCGEMDQLDKIFKVLGTPTDDMWKGWRSLKHAKIVQTFKKNIKNKLRDKFPKIALEEGDMYLSDLGCDLLQKMLVYDPEKRISAKEALDHPWFKESPVACDPSKMPKLFPTNEVPREQIRKRRMKSMDKEQQRQREEMYENDNRFDVKHVQKYYNE